MHGLLSMWWILGALIVVAFIFGSPMAWQMGGRAVSRVQRLLGFSTDSLQAPMPDEDMQILAVATTYGVDPRFLAAIRLAENGREGREYGVLSVPAPTYSAQLAVTAKSVSNSMARYREDFGAEPTDETGRLTPEFIRYFGARWAPIGAENDPGNLNTYWTANVSNFYGSIEVA